MKFRSLIEQNVQKEFEGAGLRADVAKQRAKAAADNIMSVVELEFFGAPRDEAKAEPSGAAAVPVNAPAKRRGPKARRAKKSAAKAKKVIAKSNGAAEPKVAKKSAAGFVRSDETRAKQREKRKLYWAKKHVEAGKASPEEKRLVREAKKQKE
jgi:hypothetical protein